MASFSSSVSNIDNSSDAVSDNIIDGPCEPCMRNNQTKPATLICKACNVLLCDKCRQPHTIHTAGKHDIVLLKDVDSVPVVVDMKGMDTCLPHGKKIRFYCQDHSKLCCTTCAVLHGKCNRLDEIASVSERQVPAPSFLQKILQQSEADADSEIGDCKQSETDLNKYVANISEELQEMKDRFMKLFDMTEKKIMNEANAIKSEEAKLLDERHAASSKVKTEVKEMLSICSNLLKHGTKEQKYIFWRNIVEKITTFQSDITDQRKKKVATTMKLRFPEELLSVLEKGNTFMQLSCERNKTVQTSPTSVSSQPRPLTLELLVSVNEPKPGDDETEPLFTGLDFLPDGRLVALDCNNKKCIILDERLKRLGTPYKFKSHPYCVVCVSHDALCVTVGYQLCLLSVSTDNSIRLTREINASSKFFSICCMSLSDMVVSTFDDARPARIISVDGVESDFDHVTFPMKTYKIDESMCTYVQSKNTLVLTDRLAHSVLMYDTVNGTSRAVTDVNIQEPRGACVGPGATVLVCSMRKNSIVHLSVDGAILGTYPVDMVNPWSICVSKDGTRLAVSDCVTGTRKLQLYKISLAMS